MLWIAEKEKKVKGRIAGALPHVPLPSLSVPPSPVVSDKCFFFFLERQLYFFFFSVSSV
jgi:hypothetical protein